MTTPSLLRWEDGPPDQPWLRFASHETDAAGRGLHVHDFYEAFWVAEGELLHLTPDGEESLTPGVVLYIRPDDCHDFRSRDPLRPARLMTVAIGANEEHRLRTTYAADMAQWPWRSGGEPLRVPLPPAMQQRLGDAAWAAARSGQRRLDVDAVASLLLVLAAPLSAGAPPSTVPQWLQEAIRVMSLSPLVAGGVPTLISLCNRSADHVAASTRKHLGCSPTELVNRLRIERAAQLLRLRGASIPEAARAVGFANLGHFYRLFKQRFGTTPSGYRQ